MANQDKTLEERIANALGSDVPKIYFNGYVNNLSTGDVMLVLERAGLPVGVLNMSFTVAKSLSASLGQLVAQLEVATGRSMLTTLDVETSLMKFADETQKRGKG